MDVTASGLAAAAALMTRLLTARTLHPAHAGALLRADDTGLHLLATDGEVTVHLRVPATVHTPGEVIVPRRGLADTLTALDPADARLTVQGGRLAIRVPGARFALPSLPDAVPPAADLPPLLGSVPGEVLRAAAVPVAGAASREHALPMFTGVRLRTHADALTLFATDRFRLATAAIPWQPAPPDSAGRGAASTSRVEALIPAAVLTRAAQHLGRVTTVHIHADDDLFALSWDGGSIITATIGGGYPDAQLSRLLDVTAVCTVEVDADTLAQAVDRAATYGGPHGRVTLQPIEGALLIRAEDPLTGESEQTIKATVDGSPTTRSFQARLLTDALRAFPRHPVQLRFQEAMRATAVTATAPSSPDLHYLVVPLRTPPAP
ncbi:hypothetical protein Daura_14675 [Dactylosporangium aurantiacum]|uniref:DNA polymerase III subunit beta n=1 Tax=Dactylosporangium aurantiacum TaxID=35754 RepID=A0A9Q9MQ74_9ACTN|nr:hypothetical protein [Dactylosporangium aurantiacum]MDG6109948.1 hypothetical protein [Dactylosporangium aurantiacum]UWZ57297.1 hypothetical protein Daura_14675 [Dactylosporangium aurantiacum]